MGRSYDVTLKATYITSGLDETMLVTVSANNKAEARLVAWLTVGGRTLYRDPKVISCVRAEATPTPKNGG